MKALFYIIYKSVKNSLKELLKKPGKLVLYLLVILGIAGVTVMSFFTTATDDFTPAPLFWFAGILFAFVAMFMIIAILKGTSNGDVIFDMNDVNLLFVSPVSPRKVLLYGIIKLTKVSFLAGFFILFQTNSLANFGIDFGGVLLTMLGFMLSVVVLSIVSLVLYSITNGNGRRKLIFKFAAFAPFLPLLIYFASNMLNTGDVLASLETAVKSPFLTYVPIAGWTAAGVTAFLSGEFLAGFLFSGANVLLGAGLTSYIMLTNPDYYEDTLVATETVYEKKRAFAEGDINAATMGNAKVKVKKTGISGCGASALFYKHLRESFRENRFGFLTVPSLFIIIGAVGVSYWAKDLVTVMQILMWVQLFMIGTGRGLKETYSHYIYMIPESSFSKILWSNMEIMFKTLIESVLIFGIGGVLIQANIFIILLCIAAYTIFSLLLLGVNYLFMRYIEADISMGILVFIYFIAVIIIMLPGLVPALIAGFGIGGTSGALVGLLILSAWELSAGLICFALSKGVLHNCDMSSGKPKN